MDTATDGDGIVVVGEGLLEIGVHFEDAVVVPELDLALEDLGQDAAGQVEAGGSVGDAGDVVEDGDGTQVSGQVQVGGTRVVLFLAVEPLASPSATWSLNPECPC